MKLEVGGQVGWAWGGIIYYIAFLVLFGSTRSGFHQKNNPRLCLACLAFRLVIVAHLPFSFTLYVA